MNFIVFLLMLTPMHIGEPGPEQKRISPELRGLIEAERSFAKLSTEKGMVAAFLAYFSDEGVNFQPHPTNVREAFAKLPKSEGTPVNVLNWAPLYGDIARSGNFGYSTGPFTLSRGKGTPQHGMFFSIWKKQKDETVGRCSISL